MKAHKPGSDKTLQTDDEDLMPGTSKSWFPRNGMTGSGRHPGAGDALARAGFSGAAPSGLPSHIDIAPSSLDATPPSSGAAGLPGAGGAAFAGLDSPDSAAWAGSAETGKLDQSQQAAAPLPSTAATAGLHALDSTSLSATAATGPSTHQAKTSTDFLDSIGINTHMSWLDSRYADVGAVTQALGYLGVRNVRDAITNDTVGAAFNALGDAGIKLDFFVPYQSTAAAPGQVLEWTLQQVKDHAWMTRFIEGPNEVDFWPVTRGGLTGYAAADATQRDLYAQVKADTVLSHFPVLQFTIGNYPNYAGQTDMSAYADFGTTHAYTGDDDAPGVNVSFASMTARPLNGADPVITTETGYGTSTSVSYGRVSELAQAKYLPELLAEQYAQGIKATYLYQLFDPYANADPTSDFFNYYGLFRPDGTAKPAATALHRMTTWLADPGLPFTPGTLDYALRSAPATLGSVLLQKSAGTFMLMLWNDVKAFNPDTGSDITTAPATVGLDFSVAPKSLVLLDTLTGTSTTITPGLHVSLAVPDHVVLMQIDGAAGSTAPTPAPVVPPPVLPGPAPVVSVVGLGSDTLVLKVSQDYWQGAAQYTVSIDGVQQGGVQTARAFHSDGRSDMLTLKGEWAPGQHSVAMKFVNDAYGGAAGADRNLYLDAAVYDGAGVAAAPLGKVTSAAGFTVTDATATTPKPVAVTIGTGTDALVLSIAQDAWQGSAQYTVAVDGVQQGGVQTASAYRSTGQADTVTVKGDWALGQHSVAVSFTNDAYGGPGLDRNLYLLGASYDGAAVGNSAFGQVGINTFTVTDTAPAPVSQTLGTGDDALVLKLSQDAWQANAQYTVAVDGTQIGGVQTASAYHSVGQDDITTVFGNWAVGQHAVTVTFVNDAYGGAPTRDRNLYLDDANFDGTHVATTYGIVTKASFQVSKVPPAPKSVTIGVGVDALVLSIAQDAWQGSAQYTVAVDGVQQGGVQTASAYRSTGQADTVTVKGDWALGQHSVAVSFTNDAYGGPGLDRNLYLLGASYDGAAVGNSAFGQVGINTFTVTDTAPAPVSQTLGTGDDALVLKLSQDAWQANAQYTVAVDGTQIGGVQTASAYHSVGQDDITTVFGNWAVGQHAVTVTFVNDAYGGAPTRDRNLYLDDVSYDGRHVSTYNGNIATASFSVTDTGVWG